MRRAIAAACLLAASQASGAEPAAFWSDVEPGPHGVGFERVVLRDVSRPFRDEGAAGERARRVEIAVWYPAEPSPDAPNSILPFRRYVEGDERRFEEWIRATGASPSEDAIARILEGDTRARQNAPRAQGRFPLLLFGTGLSAPPYVHTVLSEYLASHGYVCIAVPSIPPREDVAPRRNARNVEGHIRDLELALRELHDHPGVDASRLGLVAWSMGGVAQALLQMKNSNVKALVSLDAATGYTYGQRLLEDSLHFEPERATAPLLHVTGPEEAIGSARKSFRYYEAVSRGPAFLLQVEGLSHSQFTSLGSVVLHAQLGLEESAGVLEQYRRVCLYVRHFFASTLLDDAQSARFFEVAPSRHGFEGVVLSRRR